MSGGRRDRVVGGVNGVVGRYTVAGNGGLCASGRRVVVLERVAISEPGRGAGNWGGKRGSEGRGERVVGGGGCNLGCIEYI